MSRTPSNGRFADATASVTFPNRKVFVGALLAVIATLFLVPAGANAGWRGRYIDSNKSYDLLKVAYDRQGQLHEAGLFGVVTNVAYFGPFGAHLVQSNTGAVTSDLGFTIEQNGNPLLTWQQGIVESIPPPDCPECIGIDHHYQTLQQAVGPDFGPQLLLKSDEGGTGYHLNDVASDPQTGANHVAFVYGSDDHLVYSDQSLNLTALNLGGVHGLNIAAGGGTVAIAANTSTKLILFTKKGAGSWSKRVLGRSPWSYDLAVGADGLPRVVFSTNRHCCSLQIWTGKKLVRTALGVDQVALALDGAERMHIAYSRSPHFICRGNAWSTVCRTNGIGYLKVDKRARRLLKASVVQKSFGISTPLSISTTVSGGKVAIGYPDSGNDYRPMVRTKG